MHNDWQIPMETFRLRYEKELKNVHGCLQPDQEPRSTAVFDRPQAAMGKLEVKFTYNDHFGRWCRYSEVGSFHHEQR
jgi:hypothetical protein